MKILISLLVLMTAALACTLVPSEPLPDDNIRVIDKDSLPEPINQEKNTPILDESGLPLGQDNYSVATFGECVNHYHTHGRSWLDEEMQSRVSIGLCTRHAPQLNVDDTEGKCLTRVMDWYEREYPESEQMGFLVAAVSCLPAYHPK